MAVQIRTVGPEALALYAGVPIAFRVDSLLHVRLVDNGLGGMLLQEERLPRPYTKDYDAYEGGSPDRWPQRFDVRNWGFFLAQEGDRPVGAATVAWNTPGVHMLAGGTDMAALWDIRVHPDFRGQGIGKQLFWQAAAWARAHGCRLLKVETQDVNVLACHFYQRQGCALGEIDRYAYAGHPHVAHEVMLVWYLDLESAGVQDQGHQPLASQADHSPEVER
jgi:GNAT superfamily N-acetyltransferase